MPELLLPLLGFALATSATPGPNTVMVTASGANFGLRRSLPHMLGIVIGFPAMVLAIGLGLGGLFRAEPLLHEGLKWVGAAYLAWLAWRIARSGPARSGEGRGRPLTFLEAAAFQWVNPKAWMMAVGAVAAYTSVGGAVWAEVGLVAGAFMLAGAPCVLGWTLFGVGLGRLLQERPALLRGFNWSMAALLLISLVPVLA